MRPVWWSLIIQAFNLVIPCVPGFENNKVGYNIRAQVVNPVRQWLIYCWRYLQFVKIVDNNRRMITWCGNSFKNVEIDVLVGLYCVLRTIQNTRSRLKWKNGLQQLPDVLRAILRWPVRCPERLGVVLLVKDVGENYQSPVEKYPELARSIRSRRKIWMIDMIPWHSVNRCFALFIQALSTIIVASFSWPQSEIAEVQHFRRTQYIFYKGSTIHSSSLMNHASSLVNHASSLVNHACFRTRGQG